MRITQIATHSCRGLLYFAEYGDYQKQDFALPLLIMIFLEFDKILYQKLKAKFRITKRFAWLYNARKQKAILHNYNNLNLFITERYL